MADPTTLAAVERIKKWSDDCEDAKTWGGPTVYPAFPLSRAEILAMAKESARQAERIKELEGERDEAIKDRNAYAEHVLRVKGEPTTVTWEASEEEEQAYRLTACAERRAQWGEDDECPHDGSCTECLMDRDEHFETAQSRLARGAPPSAVAEQTEREG